MPVARPTTPKRPRRAAVSDRRIPAPRGTLVGSAGRRPSPVTAGPAVADLVLTPDGRDELRSRADQLRCQTLPQLRPLLTEAERDERLVAEFERAQAELDRLEQLLAAAAVLQSDPDAFDGRIELGATVTVELPDGLTETVRIVHPEEAFLDDERVSATSPLAVALLGARVGHTVWVAAPSGTWPCRVVAIRQPVAVA